MKTNCPFTMTEYRNLIRLAKTRFPVITYPEYKSYNSFIIWRHDVEYCIDEMNKLAEIDTAEGIKSTFLVQLHSYFYNFWDSKTVSTIKRWIKWGHNVGLHFDCSYYGRRAFSHIARLILFEKNILEKVYETNIHAFAFHNPNNKILQYQDNYAGLINTYNKDFFEGAVVYVSDSNGRWREKTIRDVLENPETTKAQINTHDTWWTNRRIPQITKIEKAFRKQAEKYIKSYKEAAIVIVNKLI